MSIKIPTHDINLEPAMATHPDFNRKSLRMQTERNFKSQIIAAIPLTEYEKLFHIRICDPSERNKFTFLPGQFVMLQLPGCGEIAISISGSSSNREFIELCVRKVGRVTGMLHRLHEGAYIGIRGPFGTHFPMSEMVGSNVLLIAGGLGIVPLRSPIYWVNDHRLDYKDVTILYGARDPSQILFGYQVEEWRKVYDVNILTTVEYPDEYWSGHVGLTTELFDDVPIDPDLSITIITSCDKCSISFGNVLSLILNDNIN